MFIFPVVAVMTLGGLLYAIKTENQRLVYVFKPLTSALFILTALSGGLAGAYDIRLFVGLVLCLAGDVALIPKSRTWFLVGLVAFLLGHIAYILAFSVWGPGLWPPVTWPNLGVTALILAAGGGVLAWLWPHLGRMRAPVAVYVVVISLMAWKAWTVSGLPGTARFLVPAGATLFYVSDIAVAQYNFIEKKFFTRAWGLSLYYSGQFLLAFSVAATI